LSAWKETLARRLRALRLDRIRNRILVFAVAATLLPTLVTTLVSHRQSRRLLDDRIAQELRSVSTEAARGMELWLDERLYHLRVSASYVASDPATLRQEDGGGRLRDYLNSVHRRFGDYEGMLVIDQRGRVVASSGRAGGVRLPQDRLNGLRTTDVLVGDAYWDGGLGKAVIVLAVPIRQADGRFLGAFAAKINLHSIADILQRLSPDDGRDVYLITDQGRLVIRSRVSSATLMRTRAPETATSALFENEGQPVLYKPAEGQEVVGALRRVPRLRWAAVAELPRAVVSRQVGQLRNVTMWTTGALFAAVAVVTYILGLLMVRSLERLTSAAAKVAAGDLSVDLPVGGSGEVGYLTRAFSNVVTRLREREGQGELERLSVTDALTGLYNRRHLVGTLANEVQRSRRLRRAFSVLMVDVDHFKQHNDTHGHLAGDAALVKLADILRKTTRGVDCVARYGGEEFLLMLLETTIATAAVVAERVRDCVAAEEFGGGKITVSIGVAEYPAHGDTPEELIASADAAMYRAKGEGRDRVVTARERERGKRRKGEA
jgi:diguanylate cyclase (GGDEF)-like protein